MAKRGWSSFEAAVVVLEEQRAGLGVWRQKWAQLQQVGAPLSPVRRSEVMVLALRVLAAAATTTESECRRLLVAAEVEAGSMVKKARDEVAVVIGSLDDHTGPGNGRPPGRDHDVAWPDEGDDGAAFFASFVPDGPERWNFLDDDNLVGVGPAFARRLRRWSSPPCEGDDVSQ